MGDPDALRRSLGLKPRGAPRANGREAPAEAEAAEDPKEPVTDPRRKPVGKLPPEAQQLLRNFYLARPEVDLPPHVHALEGSWGRYFGDGRADREVPVGFKPAFVLFLHPMYPTGGPKWVQKKGQRRGGGGDAVPPSSVEGELVDPGLHDQPPVTERGFVAPATCNALGEACVYIAWKSDGKEAAPPPAEEKAAESPRDARRRAQVEKRKRDLEERRKRAAARRR